MLETRLSVRAHNDQITAPGVRGACHLSRHIGWIRSAVEYVNMDLLHVREMPSGEGPEAIARLLSQLPDAMLTPTRESALLQDRETAPLFSITGRASTWH